MLGIGRVPTFHLVSVFFQQKFNKAVVVTRSEVRALSPIANVCKLEDFFLASVELKEHREDDSSTSNI